MQPLQRLSTRYALAIGGVLLASMWLMLVLAGYFVLQGSNELRRDLSASFSSVHTASATEGLRAASQYLAQRLFDPLYQLDITALNDEIAQLHVWLQPVAVLILDAQGRVVTDGTVANLHYGRQELAAGALPSGAPRITRTATGTLIDVVIQHDAKVIGCARIELSDARDRALLKALYGKVEEASWRFERGFLSIAALGLGVAAAVSLAVAWRLSASLSRPLREMRHAAEEFAAGNLTHQLSLQRDDELGRLAGSLNRMAADLQKTGRLLIRAQEMAAFASWDWRAAEDRLQLSYGIYPILGVDPRHFTGTLEALVAQVAPEDQGRFAAILRGVFDDTVVAEVRVRRADGEMRTLALRGELDRDAQGLVLGTFGTLQDITESQRIQEQLLRLANYDGLTELPNRNLFYDRLHQALTKARREPREVALLFMDLDRFKEINDTLGHDVGDALLREVALRLRRVVRESDTLARMGGDEFTLIIEDGSPGLSPMAVARKMIETLSAPFRLAEQDLTISASVGVARFPHDATTLDALIKHADIAMYAAKAQGSGIVCCFTPDLLGPARVAGELEVGVARLVGVGDAS